VTTPDQLRDIVRYIQNRIRLAPGNDRVIDFTPPDAETMVADGLDANAVRSILAAPWWSELVDDVIETPEYSEPSDSAEVVIGYARDVVQEYIWKRFDLPD
jgi:hypothetical protein